MRMHISYRKRSSLCPVEHVFIHRLGVAAVQVEWRDEVRAQRGRHFHLLSSHLFLTLLVYTAPFMSTSHNQSGKKLSGSYRNQLLLAKPSPYITKYAVSNPHAAVVSRSDSSLVSLWIHGLVFRAFILTSKLIEGFTFTLCVPLGVCGLIIVVFWVAWEEATYGTAHKHRWQGTIISKHLQIRGINANVQVLQE